MAIGTAAAIGIGLAGVGSAIGAKATSKASKRAAQTATDTAASNNALARDIYGQNQTALSPFMARGNVAGDHMNALLGLGAAPTPAPTPAPQPSALQSYYTGANPGAAPGTLIGWSNRAQPQAQQAPQPAAQAPQTTFQGQNPQQAANNAFDIFRGSTGYQFRLGEGMDALNSGWAGAGTLQSGAAMKSALEYGQNFASDEFGNYANLLANQQGVGLAGASALAGVGNNYVSNVSANNNSAGSAAANAALIEGQNNPFANAAGILGGGLFRAGALGGGGSMPSSGWGTPGYY